jgi:glycosyltransferase involved in cell wall biosynthesis
MKIAFVHQPISIISPKNVSASIEIITYELARRLATNNDVIVYAKKFHNQKEFEYDQGVRYQRISVPLDEWHTIVSSALNRMERHSSVFALVRALRRFFFIRNVRRPLNASRWYYWTYALKIAKYLREEKCDIVHIHTFSQFVPIIRACNPKIKIVLHMHCEWLTQFDHEMIESRLRETDLICGVSEYITEKIRHNFPQFAKRCQTLYNAADTPMFVNDNNKDGERVHKKGDNKELLFVGRISPEKGVHVLLEAFKKVLKQYPQVQLKIVGQQGALPIDYLIALSEDPKEMDLARFYKGDYLSNLRNQLSSTEAKHVHFVGVVPHRLLSKLYYDADAVVIPSVCNEPGAMPVVEAMACGVPVVATESGGIPEIIADCRTGLLVERADASALAEAILYLLSDDKLRKSMGKAGQERTIKLFSWNQTVKKLLTYYKIISSTED